MKLAINVDWYGNFKNLNSLLGVNPTLSIPTPPELGQRLGPPYHQPQPTVSPLSFPSLACSLTNHQATPHHFSLPVLPAILLTFPTPPPSNTLSINTHKLHLKYWKLLVISITNIIVPNNYKTEKIRVTPNIVEPGLIELKLLYLESSYPKNAVYFEKKN